MTWAQLCKLGRELPEVALGSWYGTPGLLVRGKGFVRLKENARDVVFMLESVEEQEAIIDALPSIYFITDHYRGHAAVLARLSALKVAEARMRLERAWLQKAPKTLVKQFNTDAGKSR